MERSGEASSGACCAGVHRSSGAWGSGGGSAPSRNRREAPRFPAPSSSRNGGWPLSSNRGRTYAPTGIVRRNTGTRGTTTSHPRLSFSIFSIGRSSEVTFFACGPALLTSKQHLTFFLSLCTTLYHSLLLSTVTMLLLNIVTMLLHMASKTADRPPPFIRCICSWSSVVQLDGHGLNVVRGPFQLLSSRSHLAIAR